MKKNRQLLIVGDSAFAEVAYEYFTEDSDYEVVAFSVEESFLKRERLCERPVIAFESLETVFDPNEHDVFVAVVYTQLNRLRTRLCAEAKAKGFGLASYVSRNAFVWKNVTMGEHCFVFEGNVLQPYVRLGNNVILWSGNHIGHHSVIRDNCFVSSQVVISGFVEVGENGFLGVNSAVGNNVKIAKDCWVGPGVTISQDTPEGALYRSATPEPSKATTYRFFKVDHG